MDQMDLSKKNIQISDKFSWKGQVYFKLTQKYIPKFINYTKKIRGIIFKGKNVFCSCCGKSFRKFLPAGGSYRSSAQCPGCISLERHRLIMLYLKTRTNFFSKKHKLLYIAPMKILQSIFKRLPNIDYTSIDLYSPLAMIQMDIMDIKFDDNIFDVILCIGVLEHIKDDSLAIREIYRVLKPGGWAILQSPVDYNLKTTLEDPSVILPEERRKLFGEDNHYRMYGRDYKMRIEKEGFIVIVDDFANKLEGRFIKKFGIDKDEKIYYCKK